MREIGTLLAYAMSESTGELLSLPNAMRTLAPRAEAEPSTESARERDVSVEAVRAALLAQGGNVSRSAKELGLNRSALHRLMKKHGLRDG